jgi:hypothetical protein
MVDGMGAHHARHYGPAVGNGAPSESPTGRRVYDNRHTRLTKWLNDGIPPAQVAEWAGNSVPVLLATYARCVEGQLPDLKRRLEAAGDLPELPDAG